MPISARNRFDGIVTALGRGPINTEVELTLPGGDKLVAIITSQSADALGLALGTPASAYIKASWVMLLAGQDEVRFSARNQLRGQVVQLDKGAVNSDVVVELPGGSRIHAVITHEAALELGLKPGAAATVLFKASHVILGVPT
ncbi:MAG: TOBE domain-containing protein [Azovibrio sp.]|nr:TOBE domain-containing protein [Azovibrio sp.]